MAKPKSKKKSAKRIVDPTLRTRALADVPHNIIVYSDDGSYYLITKADWGQPIPPNDPSTAALDQLRDNGAYLAYLGPGTTPGGGTGTVCTLVNLNSILKNNAPTARATRKKTSARRTAR